MSQKLTQQQICAARLEQLGYTINRIKKNWVASKTGEERKYYLGTHGSLRRGTTKANSIPAKLPKLET